VCSATGAPELPSDLSSSRERAGAVNLCVYPRASNRKPLGGRPRRFRPKNDETAPERGFECPRQESNLEPSD
jgi:hypothetical protein